jgi:hypothetical protein
MSLTKILSGMSLGWIPRWPLGNTASRISFRRLRLKNIMHSHDLRMSEGKNVCRGDRWMGEGREEERGRRGKGERGEG